MSTPSEPTAPRLIRTTLTWDPVTNASAYGVKWAFGIPGPSGEPPRLQPQKDIIVDIQVGSPEAFTPAVTLETPEGAAVTAVVSARCHNVWGQGRRMDFIARDAVTPPAPLCVRVRGVEVIAPTEVAEAPKPAVESDASVPTAARAKPHVRITTAPPEGKQYTAVTVFRQPGGLCVQAAGENEQTAVFTETDADKLTIETSDGQKLRTIADIADLLGVTEEPAPSTPKLTLVGGE